MRILVTGSRDWEDAETIEREIFRALYEMKCPPAEAVLIHGACPTGADQMAHEYAHRTGMHIIIRPAKWERYGKRAGYLRNVELIDAEPDICLAFIRNGSRGATMTAHLAETAGIETRIFA
ncbi:SLOG family protein [Streptomyces sp. NBC_01751]|uniref:SLOG family protein n=1 Tax=Streptomyces sp. NBC_01751 TaxID=2975929 RepID=UPI002DD7CA88|nr:SLOG family protein [Streptomyces sp. NBC_01751]WSD23361.1 DUF2493 domain-containing protein [Streptomyces sp. NBC_01751]